MEQRLSWLIVGAGAIGTYIGGSLILHGQKVAFLELSEASVNIANRGLRLNIHGQEHRILHPDVYSSIQESVSETPLDVAIFCLKSFDTQSILDSIHPYAKQFPPILCLQNGVENEHAIASELGIDKVIAGIVTSSVSRRAVGDIVLERARGIGIAATHPLSSSIQVIFSDAGLNAHLVSLPDSMKWSKMLTNLLANASSAILDMSPMEILNHPGLYAVEIAQLREAIRVCKAQKIKIINLPGAPVKLFAFVVNNLNPKISRLAISRIGGQGRGQKMPSFHIDLHSGRGKSEVDYLNGAVARIGHRLHISTPVNRWLNITLMGLVQGKLPMDEYKEQPGKYLDHLSKFIHDGQVNIYPMVP